MKANSDVLGGARSPGFGSLRLVTGLLLLWLAACAAPQPGPVNFEVTRARVIKADCGEPYTDCAPPADLCKRSRALARAASASVIAIDQRGRYAPVRFTLPDRCQKQPIQQPTPGDDCVPKRDGPPPEQFTDCFIEYAKQIRARVTDPPQGKRYHLLVFIHGGLNELDGRLERAFVDANRMLKGQGLAQAQVRAGTSDQPEEVWYPLFVTWPSGGLQSYIDQRAHYNQGDYDSDFKRFASPLYFATDAVESVVRAPVAWAESISWFEAGQNQAVATIGDRIGCTEYGPSYGCEPLEGPDARSKADQVWYWSPIGILGRVVSVPVVDAVGQPAWDAMVGHARMLMRKPFNDKEFAAANGKLDGKSDLWHLFQVLKELPPEQRPPITLIGHSMGAIVINEILRNFPDLPWRNIVFMGGAASVRDTVAALDLVTRTNPDADLHFYNLSLHQDAEAGEVGYLGTVSRGSLLEWVDRMYTTPATFADRTVGKWINAVMAKGDFDSLPPDPHRQLTFKRFGLSCADPLKHGDFDEYEPRPGCPSARRPYWDPAFWTVGP